MKVFISADIEGVAGISSHDECNPEKPDYKMFAEQMTAEVVAACEGALEAGAKEVVVKDAHWAGRNIDPKKLPLQTRLIRSWSGHPYLMMEGLDKSFSAATMIGYHSPAGSLGNPLSHTLNSGVISKIVINDRRASEFLINSYIAISNKVPVTFLSGDENLTREAKEFIPKIKTVATLAGFGAASDSIHPDVATDKIRQGIKQSLEGDLSSFNLSLPKVFDVELSFTKPGMAYAKSFYPGIKTLSENKLRYQSKDYFDVLRMLHFVVFGANPT